MRNMWDLLKSLMGTVFVLSLVVQGQDSRAAAAPSTAALTTQPPTLTGVPQTVPVSPTTTQAQRPTSAAPTKGQTTVPPATASPTAPPSTTASPAPVEICGFKDKDLPLIIAYYESWRNVNVSLVDYPNFPKVLLYSFAEVDDNGLPKDPINGSKVIMEGIKMVHAKGSKIYLSIGGSNNCGPELAPDFTFPAKFSGREEAFATAVMDLVERYQFDGIDIDYECKGQDQGVAVPFTKALRKKLQSKKKCLTWSAFSTVADPKSDYHKTFKNIKDEVDMIFWMAYNMHDRSFYDNVAAEYKKIVDMGVPSQKLAYGICVGNGCSYKPEVGPNGKDLDNYRNLVKANKSLGLMFWAGVEDFLNVSTTESMVNRMKRSHQAVTYDAFSKDYLIYLPGVYPPKDDGEPFIPTAEDEDQATTSKPSPADRASLSISAFLIIVASGVAAAC